MEPSIYNWIKQRESDFETQEIQVSDNWSWNFRNHVQMIFHLINGVFFTGSNEWSTQMRAFKNIIEPMINLANWTEDIEVKDVVFTIEEQYGRALSFLIKKYHDEVYSHKYNLDELFDDAAEQDNTYGGWLTQKSNDPKPETLKLMNIAFCDQADIKGGPMGFKLHFSPDRLRQMSKLGWGKESNGASISINDLIVLVQEGIRTAEASRVGQKNSAPGKSIEVYIVRGNLPEHYLKDNDNMEEWYNQVQIVAFYDDPDHNKQGVTLYCKKEDEGTIKFFTSKEVDNRALGRGVGEIMLHPQIWTNFLEIHKMLMLQAGSKVPLVTDDPTYTQKNKIQDMETLEITTIQDGKQIHAVPTISPVNVQLFSESVDKIYEHAQLASDAFDPLQGKQSASGTTFRGQNQVVQLGRGNHDRKRGKRAKWIEEIYRDWIIPQMKKDLLGGKKFLASLSAEEMQWVSEQMAECYVQQTHSSEVRAGKVISDRAELKQKFIEEFSKKGNKHMLEILKGELEDIEIKMTINVAGKQKDIAGMADKLLSIFQFIGANPQGFQAIMQMPGMTQSFNDILELSGISQVNFAAWMNTQAPQAQVPQQQPVQNQPAPQQLMQPTV